MGIGIGIGIAIVRVIGGMMRRRMVGRGGGRGNLGGRLVALD